MHVYSINNGTRKKVIIGFFIISILLSMILKAIFKVPIELFFEIITKVKVIKEIFMCAKFFNVTYDVLSVTVLYSMLFWLFDVKIWKKKWINKWLNVPDLNGIWIGEAESSTGKKYPIKMEIEQTWSKISFVSTFSETNSKSESNCASFFIETNGDKKVGFAFENKSREVEQQQYEGYNILEIDSDNKISGRYFNNRDNRIIGASGGNKGVFCLVRE